MGKKEWTDLARLLIIRGRNLAIGVQLRKGFMRETTKIGLVLKKTFAFKAGIPSFLGKGDTYETYIIPDEIFPQGSASYSVAHSNSERYYRKAKEWNRLYNSIPKPLDLFYFTPLRGTGLW